MAHESVVRFGDCEVDLARFELRRASAAVHVEPQVFDVLAYLIRHRDRMVSKARAARRGLGDALRQRVGAGHAGSTPHVPRSATTASART